MNTEHSERTPGARHGLWSRIALPPGVLLPLQLGALLAAAVLVDRIALATASGVTYPDPTNRDNLNTEFINNWWWFSSLVLCVPLWLFGRRWWRVLPCLVAVVLVAPPQFWAASVTVQRYRDSGWGSGLEMFAFVEAMFLSACFLIAMAHGAATSPRRRQYYHERGRTRTRRAKRRSERGERWRTTTAPSY